MHLLSAKKHKICTKECVLKALNGLSLSLSLCLSDIELSSQSSECINFDGCQASVGDIERGQR